MVYTLSRKTRNATNMKLRFHLKLIGSDLDKPDFRLLCGLRDWPRFFFSLPLRPSPIMPLCGGTCRRGARGLPCRLPLRPPPSCPPRPCPVTRYPAFVPPASAHTRHPNNRPAYRRLIMADLSLARGVADTPFIARRCGMPTYRGAADSLSSLFSFFKAEGGSGEGGKKRVSIGISNKES